MQGDDILKVELNQAIAECERLRAENTQLKARLSGSPKSASAPVVPLATSQSPKTKLAKTLTTNSPADQKVSRFRSLFRGRDDVYAVRWEGKNGRTGYSPAGLREWEQPVFTKTGKRKPFRLSKPFPLSDEVVRDHLLGKHTIGIYPLLQDDTCWFVAVDFDKRSWEGDACAFLATCRETGVPASLERSRSGNGGHIWIFFAEPIQAALARNLASAILTRTMERRYALGLDSYDRLFPSQDTMPKGGFGNLIALPLQHGPRENGNSVFVDDQLRPYDDQWAHVSSIERFTHDETQSVLRKIYPTGDVINVKHSSSDYDESSDPWIAPPSERLAREAITEPLPQRVSINLANLILIEKKDLPDAFLDRLLRLAAFQNPEFYKTQAMRLSTFGKPRVIACGENLTRHIALPRGLWQEVRTLQQYVGRLHRLHENKRVVRVFDHADRLVPVLSRMYEKRLKAYKVVGYTVVQASGMDESQIDLKFAEIERIAVRMAIAFEEARGCRVESVESDTRGFDLVSRGEEPTNGKTVETRFIEVKGRAAVGEIALTANEYKTAQRLGDDYWLYVVFNCASKPAVTLVQNPARFDWEPLSKIDCYRIRADAILTGSR